VVVALDEPGTDDLGDDRQHAAQPSERSAAQFPSVLLAPQIVEFCSTARAL
jgi:hypothetical protein